MKTIKLFNAVLVEDNANRSENPTIFSKYGVVVDASASSKVHEIKYYLQSNVLSGKNLNKTFHKSWHKIVSSGKEELALHQILHYMTTYGTGHTSNFTYVPDENLSVPEIKLNFLVIRGLSRGEMVDKCFGLLNSGVALKEETVIDVLDVLKDCDYVFSGNEAIKNKEVLMHVHREVGTFPADPIETLRYLLFIATGKTLLIKNKDAYRAIEWATEENINLLQSILLEVDENELAKIFNRFKPIFLSIKKIVGEKGKSKINKISKLSKVNHQPMSYNILNNIGSCSLSDLTAQEHNLVNANFFQIARCLNYLKRSQQVTHKAYKIRNGKSYVKEVDSNAKLAKSKINFLLNVLKKKYDLSDKSIYIPNEVFYALPNSEKNFVGKIPSGTKFVSKDRIASGIYWENSGGARDIDISALSVSGKVGWNASYCNEVMYSGDITDAPDGAVEYVMAGEDMKNPQLINCNIFYGNSKGAKMKVVLGKGSEINKDYMMDPNKVWFISETESVDKQSIVGLMYKDKENYNAIVLNLATGNQIVSGNSVVSNNFRTALCEEYQNSFYLNEILEKCGAKLVSSPEEADIDLTPNRLEKDTLLNLFK